MAVNMVEANGEIYLDLREDTLELPEQLLDGIKAHNKLGEVIVGNIPNNGYLEASIDPSAVSEYVIPAGYFSGGKIKFINITHYYYNGVLLPKLPDEVNSYPYAWIRKNTSTGYYDLILSTKQNYMYSSSTVRGSGTAGGDKWFRISISSASSATSWGSVQSHNYTGWTVDTSRPILWANYDILASASSTSVHFAGSDPVPAT